MKICMVKFSRFVGGSRVRKNGLKKETNKEYLVIEYSEKRILRILAKNNEYKCARLLN